MSSFASVLPPVLSANSMREADRRTIEQFGLPGFTLMETAGRAVAEEALLMLQEIESPRVVCLCGKGNNGGDGFVAGRILRQAGCHVSVVKLFEPHQLQGDAAKHFELLISLEQQDDFITLATWNEWPGRNEISVADLCIDALLGTGLSSDVRDPFASAISWLNDQHVPVLSVDLPSGISADDGRKLGVAVNADVTVTMGALKTGLLVNDGPDYAGAIVIAEIGIPHHILEDVAKDDGPVRLCQPEFVSERIPSRTRTDHKYSSGPTIVIGGSAHFSGAPVLSATAAARIGSGYVGVVTTEDIAPVIAEKLTEIPVTAIDGSDAEEAIQTMTAELGNRWEKAKSILIGPGLGREPYAKQLVLGVLEVAEAPVVVDADGLFALEDEQEFVRSRSDGNWILTPHRGEFSRLFKDDTLPSIKHVQAYAADWNVTVLLKGMPSISAAPDGRVIINDTGNPAAGTAGSGDVLAGMIAGLLAQGLSALDASACAIHIAGSLADQYAMTHSPNSMMATDILDLLPSFLSDM